MTKIFLDCDGVLADFDSGARDVLGRYPRQFEKLYGADTLWTRLENTPDFYRDLPLMPDAMQLVEGVRHLDVTILTGVPRGGWAEEQKVLWAAEHFPHLPIICCRSAEKRAHMRRGDVLIDDWPQYRHYWLEHGGVFISHYDAETSLAALWAHYPELSASRHAAARTV